jgi:hypothetical protein
MSKIGWVGEETEVPLQPFPSILSIADVVLEVVREVTALTESLEVFLPDVVLDVIQMCDGQDDSALCHWMRFVVLRSTPFTFVPCAVESNATRDLFPSHWIFGVVDWH